MQHESCSSHVLTMSNAKWQVIGRSMNARSFSSHEMPLYKEAQGQEQMNKRASFRVPM